MASNAKKAGAVAKAEPTESKLKAARFRAKTAPHPSVNAAMVIEEFGERFWDLNVGELAVHLKDGMNDVSKNDLHGCEAMLYSQAHALQAIFVSSAHRATLSEEWFPNYEAHMRLALKAQSQCRATLETLATIKNPPVVFARQANIAQGPQQVPFGQVAKNHLSNLVNGQTVKVNYYKRDRYGRIIGKVLANGADAGLRQIEAGLAWHYEQYQGEQDTPDRACYANVELRRGRRSVGFGRCRKLKGRRPGNAYREDA